MIERIAIYESEGFDPHRNLAIEQHLLETVLGGCCLLYLWQNERTVVIGRNQSAWAECRTTQLFEDGGRLARRLSGGGAVYHDRGNLNFTFLMREEDYDLNRQLAVIQRACSICGIETEISGRNDLLADGRKFSGNAFYHHEGRAYHHGTLLVDVDAEAMTRYLSPSKAKLEAKGVESVRSRVVNLKELNPALTVDLLKAAMRQAFREVYGVAASCHSEERSDEESSRSFADAQDDTHLTVSRSLSLDPPPVVDEARIEELTAHYASDAWLFGQKLPFTFRCEQRFLWGGLELQLRVDRGVVQSASVYTDDMDPETAPMLQKALLGCPFSLAALKARVEPLPHGRDIIQMLTEQEI